MKLIRPTLCVLAFLCCIGGTAQSDKKQLRKIYDAALTESDAYENLRALCKIGGRLSGSENLEKAVVQMNELLGGIADTVYLQEVMVPKWVRGEKEEAVMTSKKGEESLAVCALGFSVGTDGEWIEGEVVEVFGIDELEDLGDEVKGKIVFYNRPMEPRHIDTFHAYSGCVDQRSTGASAAAPGGALAVLVRSMNLRDDDLPHTGVQRYADGVRKIPALAISTRGADNLSKRLKEFPKLKVKLKLNSMNYPDVLSHNVIAELKGSENPENIIVVSGHLDSWDTAEGAHDDGAGVVQSIEVLNLYKKLGLENKNTIRCVLWTNEENGPNGAIEYARWSAETNQQHILAIESDRGGFSPRGFSIDGEEGVREPLRELLLGWEKLLKPYKLHYFEFGFGGVDINRLKDQGVPLLGLVPDSQRYFDHHHAPNDNFDGVNKRELELGAAAMTAIVFLFDKYGSTGM